MDQQEIKDRLEHLYRLKEQHGTATGDTSERKYEEVCDEIEELESKLESGE